MRRHSWKVPCGDRIPGVFLQPDRDKERLEDPGHGLHPSLIDWNGQSYRRVQYDVAERTRPPVRRPSTSAIHSFRPNDE